MLLDFVFNCDISAAEARARPSMQAARRST